ncbi:MAG TPA: hypothetical protein VHZ50_00605 [Puia sp.]|nr:hypothetical protein [Puia sp.]
MSEPGLNGLKDFTDVQRNNLCNPCNLLIRDSDKFLSADMNVGAIQNIPNLLDPVNSANPDSDNFPIIFFYKQNVFME